MKIKLISSREQIIKMYNDIQTEKCKAESVKKCSNQTKRKIFTFRMKCKILLSEKVEYKRI